MKKTILTTALVASSGMAAVGEDESLPKKIAIEPLIQSIHETAVGGDIDVEEFIKVLQLQGINLKREPAPHGSDCERLCGR